MISANQIRAARLFLNIDQKAIAESVGVSVMNISDIENEKGNSRASTIDGIRKVFESRGLRFTDAGGVEPSNEYVSIYDGPNCYWRFLNDAQAALTPTRGEILFSGSDERRSPPEIVEKLREMRANGVSMRSLIENGNTVVMGALMEYRWMPGTLFVDGDVKVIYGDCVAYLVSWAETPRVIVVRDATIAEEARRQFEFVWGQSEEVPLSTASERYVADNG